MLTNTSLPAPIYDPASPCCTSLSFSFSLIFLCGEVSRTCQCGVVLTTLTVAAAITKRERDDAFLVFFSGARRHRDGRDSRECRSLVHPLPTSPKRPKKNNHLLCSLQFKYWGWGTHVSESVDQLREQTREPVKGF
ncbi:hypothetical protein FH972_020858 [Carpinus fangiana]|uniref:Uncharacterized protein n=1 Tax=Carpinus fangiana TaxID=176857 RepID=A0A5N6RXY4_9ROSI|nr:hypothetical protein FH972_020858 [Carpinus fangiana]